MFLKNGGASLEGLVVGLDWLDLDFFFHHFFQGSVPKFEFRPKMRTRRAWGRRGGGRGRRGLSKKSPCLSKMPPCSHGALGAPKGTKNVPMGARGRPLGLGPYGPYVCLLYTSDAADE